MQVISTWNDLHSFSHKLPSNLQKKLDRVSARRSSLTFGTNIWKKNNEGLKIRSGAFWSFQLHLTERSWAGSGVIVYLNLCNPLPTVPTVGHQYRHMLGCQILLKATELLFLILVEVQIWRVKYLKMCLKWGIRSLEYFPFDGHSLDGK